MTVFLLLNSGDVNFKEFISCLSVFNTRGDRQEKLEFAFRVYDIDGDGFISNGELYSVCGY